MMISLKDYVTFSFTLTYILLITTGTITFIEALSTKNPFIRHVMNLETCVSIVAGYFYGVFVSKIKQDDIKWSAITQTRYIDWCITTPMMLLTLCLVLGNQINVPIKLFDYVLILIMNYTMLYIGYLGEKKKLTRNMADILGYIAFHGLFGYIYYCYVYPKYVYENYMLFSIYMTIWSIYGLAYLLNEVNKNVAYNVLDLVAKCLVGLGLWAYYTKIIQ